MRPWVIVLIVLISLVLIVSVGFLVLIWSIGQGPSVDRETVLELRLSGHLPEAPSENPFEVLLEPDTVNLYDYWRLLNYAADDPRVKALYLEVGPLQMGWAQLDELRDSLHRFRESGKQVHAFLAVDMVSESELFLASAADSITINPDTMLIINGLAAEVMFYKGTLEKLDIVPQFFQFKEFKSPEIYDRDRMSQPVREMYLSLIGGLENRFKTMVSADRGIDVETVQALVQVGMVTPEDALEARLIDAVGYRHQVHDRLTDAIGKDSFTFTRASRYFKSVKNKLDARSRNRVALVMGSGIITSGKSDAFSGTLGGSSLAETLRNIRERESFDAVLMRVDSPGGSAVGSDMVWEEVRMLEKANIPVVVSMSSVAGSGGYYISMGARRIICQPTTITGSIGVIFGKFNLEGLFNWLGMTIEQVKVSPNADLFSPFTSLTDDQADAIKKWMEEVYTNFVSKAAEGRGVTFDELEKRAHGKVYTGQQALEIGLIDDLGGYTTALQHLREVLELSEDADLQLVKYPPAKGLWETLAEVEYGTVRSETRLLQWLERELDTLTAATPRVLMPEAVIR